MPSGSGRLVSGSTNTWTMSPYAAARAGSPSPLLLVALSRTCRPTPPFPLVTSWSVHPAKLLGSAADDDGAGSTYSPSKRATRHVTLDLPRLETPKAAITGEG